MITIEQAWQAVHLVPDPEIPVISVTDLGIVREIQIKGEIVHIALTPTYSGCPATQEIQRDVEKALLAAGASSVEMELDH
jgi:ring-1,2-phenylacetyl-CoA epoxidase subunit PaaD